MLYLLILMHEPKCSSNSLSNKKHISNYRLITHIYLGISYIFLMPTTNSHLIGIFFVLINSKASSTVHVKYCSNILLNSLAIAICPVNPAWESSFKSFSILWTDSYTNTGIFDVKISLILVCLHFLVGRKPK